jgi:hypothetical protein
MKNSSFIFLLCLFLSCTKTPHTGEEIITPTTAEKKIIDAASGFFKGDGDYNKIQNIYRVAVRPVLTVRRVLNESACTYNFFNNECCCSFEFSLTPYDVIAGNDTSRSYPKTATYTAKPGKMGGSFSAVFASRPSPLSTTEVRYDNLVITDNHLNGIVSVRDVAVSPRSNNVMCVAEFSNNSLSVSSMQITSITGYLSFSDGDASGKLEITYANDVKIITEISTLAVAGDQYVSFLQNATFTIDGMTSAIDFSKQTITIGSRTFKLSL